MTDNEMNNMEEDIIIFEDEDGNEYSYVVVDYMFYNGEEYALLTESDIEEDADENGQECIICKVHDKNTVCNTMIGGISFTHSPCQ